MKGLLIKDLKLMKSRRSFFALIVAMGLAMAAFMDDPAFIVGYLMFVGVVAAESSISYDEFDHGNAFLFSLPVTRKSYTVEKYGFVLLFGLAFWLFATVIVLIAGTVRGVSSVGEMLTESLFLLPILLFMLSVTIPFRLKYGSEKGRLAMVGAALLLFLVYFVLEKAANFFSIDLMSVLDHFFAMNVGLLLSMLSVIGAALMLLSLNISIYIMNQKEF